MTVSQSDIPKPHYTAPVAMDHVWDQDVGVFTATELEGWAHLASVGHLTQWSAEILASGFGQSEEDCPLQSYQGQSTSSLLHLVNCIKQCRRRRATVNGARPVPAEEIPLQ